ncbi:MAG: hypothetical protein IPP33_02510 [Flavobacteriales bacterium]|nr:hypothetical protein [Flavobacteriales bacterium]
MPITTRSLMLSLCLGMSTQFVGAQFANAYVHLMSDDHTSVVKSIAGKHYIQASTTLGTTGRHPPDEVRRR